MIKVLSDLRIREEDIADIPQGLILSLGAQAAGND